MSGAESSRSADIRALRPARPALDPWLPQDQLIERERSPDGGTRSVATIFLTGSECPFTCVYCDLWRFTLASPTPPGSLPRQVDTALEALGEAARQCSAIKLYNASNFFEARAVPDRDVDDLVARLGRFELTIVESHPRLVGRRATRLAERLPGHLEVAMGLESIHPEVLPRLNKEMRLEDFDRAADFLQAADISVRAFVLLGVPFLDGSEQVEWSRRAVEHAIDVGCGHVSIIPLRGGNGELERLAADGNWVAPTLKQVEAAAESCIETERAVVTVDLWDLERLATCEECLGQRFDRLRVMNLTGKMTARVSCRTCDQG